MTNRLGTLQDVADYLGIQTDTARRWARCGYLPSIALGRDTGKVRRRQTLRFDMDGVRQWVMDQRRKVTTDAGSCSTAAEQGSAAQHGSANH